MNFRWFRDLETSETGVQLLPWLAFDLLILVSEIGVIVPVALGNGLVLDLAGIESLRGGLADLSLSERSRTLTLLLTFNVALPLNICNQKNQ